MLFTQWNAAGALQIPRGHDSCSSTSSKTRLQAANQIISLILQRQVNSKWSQQQLQKRENQRSATNFTSNKSDKFFKCWSYSLSKMQAVRQCLVCASRGAGGLVRNQTDISLLQTNKSSFRRGAACMRFLRYVMNIHFQAFRLIVGINLVFLDIT